MRISCDSGRAAGAVRGLLTSVLVDEEAPLGFSLSSPSGRNRIYILTDRCGFVMGRSRSLDEILAILAGLLGSFLPPPEGCQRFRMRVLVRRGSGFLCVAPVLFSEPPIERHLHRNGFTLVDRLVVDLNVRSLRINNASVPRKGFGDAGAPGIGHMSPGAPDSIEVTGALLSDAPESVAPSRATTVAAISECAIGGLRSEALKLALDIEALGVHFVPLFGGGLKSLLERI